jgi:hypothetical protein
MVVPLKGEGRAHERDGAPKTRVLSRRQAFHQIRDKDLAEQIDLTRFHPQMPAEVFFSLSLLCLGLL